MARIVINVSHQYKEIRERLLKNNVLGLDTAQNLDFFTFTLALGAEKPVDALPNRDSFTRVEYCKTKEKSILSSALLGTAKSDEEMEEFIDFDTCIEYCERCSESGIYELQRLYTDADCDEDILERRMMTALDQLYAKYVDPEPRDV